MAGMELSDDPKKNEPGIHMRVLRVLLPSSAHRVMAALEHAIQEHIGREVQSVSTAGLGGCVTDPRYC